MEVSLTDEMKRSFSSRDSVDAAVWMHYMDTN